MNHFPLLVTQMSAISAQIDFHMLSWTCSELPLQTILPSGFSRVEDYKMASKISSSAFLRLEDIDAISMQCPHSCCLVVQLTLLFQVEAKCTSVYFNLYFCPIYCSCSDLEPAFMWKEMSATCAFKKTKPVPVLTHFTSDIPPIRQIQIIQHLRKLKRYMNQILSKRNTHMVS